MCKELANTSEFCNRTWIASLHDYDEHTIIHRQLGGRLTEGEPSAASAPMSTGLAPAALKGMVAMAPHIRL
jgi:hypothetical protein